VKLVKNLAVIGAFPYILVFVTGPWLFGFFFGEAGGRDMRAVASSDALGRFYCMATDSDTKLIGEAGLAIMVGRQPTHPHIGLFVAPLPSGLTGSLSNHRLW
jgi:hypothetical protein